MTPGLHCNRWQLQQLLADSLPEQDENEISSHLSSCPDCQRELQLLAAGEEWWSEAGERLSRTAAQRSASTSGGGTNDSESDHFATDFAVDFLEPSSDPSMLGRLGDYEIVEVIGRGGMGIVLKGFQKELHRHVAVKVLSPHLATSGAARQRFAREAQATAAVVHPHVMAIHSVNAAAKLPYLVMPFVPCESLQQRIDRHGPLDVKDILRIGMQAAAGLAAAHAQGLVHRDVTPSNILLETNVDRVLLTDFGLARAMDDATLTRTGIIAGTPLYMSPEQAGGDAIDFRSDLFSLGSVLYAMCTGRSPFRAESTFGVLRRIRESAPRSIREINADIPLWLERIVLKLLEKQASDRLASAQDVASVLEQCLAHVQQPTTVALPASVGEWKLLPTESPLEAPRTALSDVRPRRGLVIGMTSLAALVAFVLWMKPLSTPQSTPPQVPRNDPSPDPETAGVEHPGLPLDWHDTQVELDDAEDVLEQLEASTKRDLSPESDIPQQERQRQDSDGAGHAPDSHKNSIPSSKVAE